MNEPPAFNVRAYPAFRMARNFRVYVDRDALYLIRMSGVFGNADAGPRHTLHPGKRAIGMLLRWWVEKSQSAQAHALDATGPRMMLDSHPHNRRVEPAEVVESRLRPPQLLGYGEHLAHWSLTVRDRRPLKFQIEDAESLKTALEHLPRLLGPALRVSVGWDDANGEPVRVAEPPPR